MKVLQISPPWIDTPPKNYGGTEWVVANLCDGLLQAGHEVTLFATKESYTQANLKYLFHQGLTRAEIPWEASLPALLHYDQALEDSSQYDLIHFHLSSQTDLVSFPYIKKLTVPHVLTIHGHWPYDVFSYMDEHFQKLYAKYINVISISKFMQSALPKSFNSIGYAYNAINLESMKFNPSHKGYLTWLGRMVPDKGLYEAIRAAKKANEQFIFAGVVDTYNQQQKNYFEQKIKPHIDGEQIQYIGPADHATKNILLSNAKAFLNPIQWDEPFGMVMIESMSCGTPVISFERGAATELIKQEKTGFLVQSVNEMVQAIKKIDTIDRHVCREHIAQNFTVAHMTKQYLHHYHKVIRSFHSAKSRQSTSASRMLLNKTTNI
jgi:glycosyltransferase involved in cell wall biosynthesis